MELCFFTTENIAFPPEPQSKLLRRYRVRFLNHIGQITSDSEFKEALALSSSRSMSGGMSPAPTAEPSPPPKEGTGADASADEHV